MTRLTREPLTCPDCIAEGVPMPLTREDFSWSGHGRWQHPYCKRHTSKRTMARRTPGHPDYDPVYHEQYKAAQRRRNYARLAARGGKPRSDRGKRRS